LLPGVFVITNQDPTQGATLLPEEFLTTAQHAGARAATAGQRLSSGEEIIKINKPARIDFLKSVSVSVSS
jgi:hypothetical protein